ncbi:MAG: Thymidylate synthase [Thelocarpon superellum]|nr:MAG: Thymidylate synthase [Thelocarpon superellum]
MTPSVIHSASNGSDRHVNGDTTKSQAPVSENTPPSSGSDHEEHQYLNLIRDILASGEHRPDRTGTGTLSIFAPPPLKFSLSTAQHAILPLLTTKRVFTRAVIEELLWFITGNTSSTPLSEAGIKIWDGNGSREYLDSVGLSHRAVGDLGPVYGFQWRHFGAEYVDANADYTGLGVDQLAAVIKKLRDGPYDRRIILSAWNPADLSKMALPPCHMFAQFYVSFPDAPRGVDAVREHLALSQVQHRQMQGARGTLHCQLYQRSCDMGLGVPFNIASYSLLTHMLAHVCDLTPGTFTHTMGDAHVYLDHVDALKEQLTRTPRPFPELVIRRDEPTGSEAGQQGEEGVEGGKESDGVVGLARGSERTIDGWKLEEFEIKGYQPHKSLAMKMSV